MKRPFLFGLALAVASSACDGNVTGSTTQSTTSSTGGSSAEGGGGAASTGGTGGASSTGSTGGEATAGAGGAGGSSPCVEPEPLAPECSLGPKPASCGCAEEATALLPALAAAAKGAFEAGGALCGSAIPIPAVPPAGNYYRPCLQPGVDFQTGDSTTGWICLAFDMPSPIHCRYTYTQGSSPLTAARGGPDPVSGPESFEVSAEGDDDGDNVTSAFAITGQLDASGEMVLSPMFVDQPGE